MTKYDGAAGQNWKFCVCLQRKALRNGEKMEVKKILIVFGTRPEAIKMLPLVFELKKRKCFEVKICVTGQHKEMLSQVLDLFAIEPDHNLEVMRESQNLTETLVKIQTGMAKVLEKEKPSITLVHGDTLTAMATAVTCFLEHYAVGHVEAGLRTYKIGEPFPEEFDRRVVSLIAKYHFAPTQSARDNLMKEGIRENVYVTGNTSIDMFQYTVQETYTSIYLEEAKDKKLILVTIHRRENWNAHMENIFHAIQRVAEEYGDDILILYPVHKNPKIRKAVNEIFINVQNVKLMEPLDVVEFHNIMSKAYLIVTDSGGIQEEAPYFDKPVLVARNVTERPEGIEAGTLKLIGTEEESVYQGIRELLENDDMYMEMSKASNPYGDGTASIKIANILEEELYE